MGSWSCQSRVDLSEQLGVFDKKIIFSPVSLGI